MNYAGLELREVDGSWYFENLAMADQHDARRPVEEKREAFITKHQLKESKSRTFPGWGILVPKELRPRVRDKYTNHFSAQNGFEIMAEVKDHDELFVCNGKYVYTTQPYDLSLESYKQVESLWRGLGLYVDISYEDAWHYPGRTPLIVISQEPVELSKA